MNKPVPRLKSSRKTERRLKVFFYTQHGEKIRVDELHVRRVVDREGRETRMEIRGIKHFPDGSVDHDFSHFFEIQKWD